MNPFKELRSVILGKQPAQSGVIVQQLNATTFRVQTPNGVIETSATDGNAYHAGDEVLLRGSIIQGRVRAIANIPTYNV